MLFDRSEQKIKDKKKRVMRYSEDLWPKRSKVEEVNEICASYVTLWNSVETIKVGDMVYPYCEYTQATYSNKLSHGELTVSASGSVVNIGSQGLPDLISQWLPIFTKAKLLYDTVRVLPRMPMNFKVIQRQDEEGRECRSDADSSGDEQIPDPPIVAPFSSENLAIVQERFDELLFSYRAGRSIGFHNALGKTFMVALGKYAMSANLSSNKGKQYLSLMSTSTGETQPGAAIVKWLLPPSHNTNPTQEILHTYERYADCVLYDTFNFMNIVVVEIKVEESDPSTSLNNEQMVGLWKTGQIAMLGLEVSTSVVKPKIFLLHDGCLKMFHLKYFDISNPNELSELLKLYISFVTCVKYCEA